MDKHTPELNSLVVEKIFSYLQETEKDQQTFRLIKRLWYTETVKLWRKSATVIIQPILTSSGEDQLENNFLNEFINICEDNDPHNLINLPFRHYKIINVDGKLLSSCGGKPCDNEAQIPPPLHFRPSLEFNNFWRICAFNITHLEISHCIIHNKKCLINLLTSLLFEDCPSLKKLSLDVEGTNFSEDKVNFERRTSSIPVPSSRSSLTLEYFGFRSPWEHFPFQIWGNMPILKQVFALFPQIKELKLEENAVQLLKTLKYPVTPTEEYIKLGKVVIKIKDPRNFRLLPFCFSSLKEYVQAVTPPLNQFEASISLNDIRKAPTYHFHSFFTYWGSHLTHLDLNIDLKHTYGFMDNHFTDLSGRNFPQLTHFQLYFVNDSKNISFDFGALRKMPELKVFRCGTDAFKNIRSYRTNYGNLMDVRRIFRSIGMPDEVLEWMRSNDRYLHYSGTTHDWNRNINAGQHLEAFGEDQIIIQNLTEFSLRLNYKFGKEAVQLLKSWAGNIKILEIVIDDEQMFLDFLGKEFQWWSHSLDKLVLHCETNLDTEEIKNAIRGEKGRPVEMQFCQLEKPPYPQCMYRYA